MPTSDGPKYWVSERSVGEFARTISFPKQVDQENVKAGLKNGILSIIVPKAVAPQSKRINIE
jgi:HSP20 family molecular chaperone IbpA